jgi:hypothetical protein
VSGLAISRETATAIVGCLVVVRKLLSPFHGFVFCLILFRGPMAHGYVHWPLRGLAVPQRLVAGTDRCAPTLEASD